MFQRATVSLLHKRKLLMLNETVYSIIVRHLTNVSILFLKLILKFGSKM